MLSKINPRKLFLLDGLGAVLSTLMHGVVLVLLENKIGMPVEILYKLALVTFIFSIFSFLCFWNFNEKWRSLLRTIAIANLLFCVVSLCLIVYLYEQLSLLGLIYFIVEIIIVSILALFELKVARE